MFDNYGSQSVQQPKSTSFVGSVVVHVGAVLAIFLVGPTVTPYLPQYTATRLYVPAPAPAPPIAPKPRKTPVSPFIAPRPSAVLTRPVSPTTADLPTPPEPTVARPAPLPQRPSFSLPGPPPPAPVRPVFASALPAAGLSAPTVKAPQTGAFAAVPAATAAAVAKLQTPGGTFGTVPADAPLRSVPTATGGPAGFGATAVTSSTARREPSFSTAIGFGGVAAVGPVEAVHPQPKSVATGFGAAIAAEPARQSAAPRRIAAQALEILYKPRPAYTDEARRARIEGDVVLEVLFPSTGPLHVQRVVHGLGFGLDQNATDAAGKIRFRPATVEGRPVDTVATIRISFQMAY